MPPRKKTGRAAAEAAYASLLKENTALVGDVGEAFDNFVAKLAEAAAARDQYEDARAAAVKRGAVTNDQLDQMGYKRTSKLPAPPSRPTETPGPAAQQPAQPEGNATNAAAPAHDLVSVGARTGEEN
ncbi:hypothetical protein [Mycolicibacterium neoaurum]|uniref:hypothetical protein n=1 Tax=Mycolicibacterium neoaurum TaxID=1795 RepID=UPI001F4D294E|nr:hypothetical protein [Mycolicibacterium neoaurum]